MIEMIFASAVIAGFLLVTVGMFYWGDQLCERIIHDIDNSNMNLFLQMAIQCAVRLIFLFIFVLYLLLMAKLLGGIK